jgi:hypothetical protein
MSSEDDKLVNFLRQYRPLPPTGKGDREEQLMLIIAREAKVKPKRPLVLLGTITSLIALSTLIFAVYRWFNPHPQVANISDEELEAFLVESWSNTVDEPSSSPTVDNFAWNTFNEPNLTYSTYNP